MRVLQDDPSDESADQLPEIPAQEERPETDRVIVCAACEAAVTHGRHRISVHGSHEHRFMNPAGFLFHFGCFAEAIGCRVVGPDSHEYAWFPGHTWRFALCGSCGQHVGWHFRSDGGASFFGLILDRLREPTMDT
jgi:hypothetical protein